MRLLSFSLSKSDSPSSALFPDPFYQYLHLRLKCWQSPTWEVEKEDMLGPQVTHSGCCRRLLCYSTSCRSSDVSWQPFILLHVHALAAVPISREGQVWAIEELLHSGPWGVENLELLWNQGKFLKGLSKGEGKENHRFYNIPPSSNCCSLRLSTSTTHLHLKSF